MLSYYLHTLELVCSSATDTTVLILAIVEKRDIASRLESGESAVIRAMPSAQAYSAPIKKMFASYLAKCKKMCVS